MTFYEGETYTNIKDEEQSDIFILAIDEENDEWIRMAALILDKDDPNISSTGEITIYKEDLEDWELKELQ